MKSTKLYDILLSPIISEKSTLVGESSNQAIFRVRKDATKFEVKSAVELLFKVKVDSVQILNLKGKAKKYGRISGRRDHTKKAYVCLSQGEEIDFGGGSS